MDMNNTAILTTLPCASGEKTSTNLFYVVFLFERMECKSRDLQYPSAVDVTASTGQVTVWLKHRLVQINHPLYTVNTNLA